MRNKGQKRKNSYADNPLLKTLFSLEYDNPKIKKSIGIFRRTKSIRIKNKHFDRIVFLAVKEKQVIHVEDVVLLDYNFYQSMQNRLKNLNFETK